MPTRILEISDSNFTSALVVKNEAEDCFQEKTWRTDEEHETWYRRYRESSDMFYLIQCDSVVVGTIAVRYHPGYNEILNVAVLKKYPRNKLVTIAAQRAMFLNPIKKWRIFLKLGNKKDARTFKKLGFKSKKEYKTFIKLEYTV